MAADPNRQMFEWVVNLLRPLLGELVFVGGCTTGLLLTDSAASGIRPTNDVDAIVDVTTYARYAALSERLRELGLKEDTTEGAPLCRWRHGGLIVDVMPSGEEVVGEIAHAASEARIFIASRMSTLMENIEFREALSGFLLPDAASLARRRLLEERLNAIAALS